MTELDLLLESLVSGDDELAEDSVRQLVTRREEATPRLLELRNSSHVDTRWWAYCALGQMPDADASWFLPGLDDPTSEVRECAAMALCHNPDSSAIPNLIAALEDQDRMVATLSGRVLVEIGNDAVPDLINILETGTPSARIEAARALSDIRDPRAIPVFMTALDSDSELVKFWAEQGLQNLGSEMVYFKPG